MRRAALMRYMVAGAFALSTAALAQDNPELDEEFPSGDLVTGKRISREQCEALRDAVWVEHREGTECIRYFPSSDVSGSKVAALFFHGDRLEGRTVISYKDNHAQMLRATAEGLAKVNRVPYIFVARPGAYGSSGRHMERRRLKEYLSLNAAVDAIKARYGLTQVHLGGQSGGATSVGALLTLGRTDVVCVAAASGGYDTLARAMDIAGQSGQSWRGCDTTGFCDAYNVTDHVSSVQKSDHRRLFIIGDPSDSNTLFKYQQAFAEKLKAGGHDVTLVEAQANGPQRHSLVHMANRTLGWCNAGFDAERIKELARTGAPAIGNAKGQTEP
jgi:pimeloyl-ACP methyl ester carboxylesterase